MYLSADKDKPSEEIRLRTRVVSGALSYPEFAVATADQVISMFYFSNSNMKLSVPQYSFKTNSQALKVLFLKHKGTKALVAIFENEFRIYKEK